MTWFDAAQVEPASAVSQLPIGKHLVIAKSSYRKAVKDDPNSGMLVFLLEIMEGQHRGASGEYRLNVFNKNAQAAEIAARQLSALCRVTAGPIKLEHQDAAELLNIPFVAMVEAQSDAKYTQVAQVLDRNGNPPQGGAGTAQQQPHYTSQAPQPAPQHQPPANSPPANWAQQPPQTPSPQQQPAWATPPQGAAPASPPAASWGNQQPPQSTPSWGR